METTPLLSLLLNHKLVGEFKMSDKQKKTFEEQMNKAVELLKKDAEFNKATGHVTFSPKSLSLPKGVTEESMTQHVNFLNDLTGQVEVATAQLAQDYYGEDNNLTTLDGGLNWGGMQLNSQHHLKQQVGDEWLYGNSTTAIDYVHSDESAEWLNTQREANKTLAKNLFSE